MLMYIFMITSNGGMMLLRDGDDQGFGEKCWDRKHQHNWVHYARLGDIYIIDRVEQA